MTDKKIEVLLIGPPKPVVIKGLEAAFAVHQLAAAKDKDALIAEIAPRLRAIAVSYTSERVNAQMLARFPKLEILSTFGVGYDHIDTAWAAEHGVTVTNTPEVLTEEVA